MSGDLRDLYARALESAHGDDPLSLLARAGLQASAAQSSGLGVEEADDGDEADDYYRRVMAGPSAETIKAMREMLHSEDRPRRQVSIDAGDPIGSRTVGKTETVVHPYGDGFLVDLPVTYGDGDTVRLLVERAGDRVRVSDRSEVELTACGPLKDVERLVVAVAVASIAVDRLDRADVGEPQR